MGQVHLIGSNRRNTRHMIQTKIDQKMEIFVPMAWRMRSELNCSALHEVVSSSGQQVEQIHLGPISCCILVARNSSLEDP